MKQLKILGIDPGLMNTGWAILNLNPNIKGNIIFVDSGTICTKSSEKNIFERLEIIYNGLKTIIDIHQPDHAAIEETFVNRNPLSSLKLGHARGAIMLTVAINNLSCYEYAARLVKKTITGSGSADKEQIKTMLRFLLPKASYDSDDSADAIAIALCHAQNIESNYLMNIK